MTELSLRPLGEGFYMLEMAVIHPYRPCIPAHPDLTTDIFIRNLIIAPVNFDIAVTMDFPLPFLIAGKDTGRQRLKCRLFNQESVFLPADGSSHECDCRL